MWGVLPGLIRKLTGVFHRLSSNEYAYSVITKVLGVIVGFVYSIVYSRYFGAEFRGEAAIITNDVGMLYIFLCMGMYQAYPYYRKGLKPEEIDGYYRSYINDTFGLFLIYMAVAVGLAVLLRIRVTYIIVILLLPTEFLVKQLNYVVLIENPKLRNTMGLRLNLFDLLVVVLLWLTVESSLWLCIGFVVLKQLVYTVLAVSNLHVNLFSIRPSLSRNIPKFMRFGLVPMVSTLLMTANYKLDIAMLDFFPNVTTAGVGIYSLGVSLAEKIWMIPDALKDILLSKLAKGKDASEVTRVIRLSLPIMLVFVLGIMLLGQRFIVFVYGAEYADAYGVTLLIITGTVFMVFYKMINSYYIVEGHRMLSFVMLLITAAVNIALNAILIPSMGMNGAAIASLVSYVSCGAMFVITFSRMTKIPISQIILLRRSDVQLVLQKIRRRK